MPALGTVLNDLLTKKAGVPVDHQALKDILSNAELTKINLPDDIVNLMNENLHTLDSAKPKLKTGIFKEALNGAEAVIDGILNEDQYDETTKAEFKAEQNTYNKIKLLAAKIKAAEAAKQGATKGEKSELQNSINELKAERAKEVKAFNDQITSLKSQHQEEMNNAFIENTLARYTYALGDIDPEVKVLTAKGVLNKALAEAGAKIINDPANPSRRILVSSDGSEYYDKKTNLKSDLKSFLEGAIAPILSTKTPEKGEGNTQSSTVVPGEKSKVNHSAIAHLQAEYNQAVAPPQG